MATNNDAKNALANRQNAAATKPATPEQTIAAYLKKMAPEIEKALPSHLNAERLGRIALTTIRTTPKLLECNVPSLLGAVMQAAQLGLEPGLIGHCYIIPYGREAQFIIGYKGMIDLARRSGQIQNIYAHSVYEADDFDYELGLNPKLVHKPAPGRRGEMKYVYAVAHFKDGGYQFEVMDTEEIERRRQRSKASKNGPWVTDYEEMAKKTVIRHMWKYLPISIEIQQQASQDETVRKDVTSEPQSVYSDAIDLEPAAAEDIREPEVGQVPANSQEHKPKDELDEAAQLNFD
ncbi:recombination protein RecT [Aneurinibacillus sp. Ricciae_BoGa-3]|uniref:recombination protein RecT n=1 Tax=Aneurinibacillus sp. Ricciae_BoGa-3 TaxID=3022697 RepID=UPI00233FEDEA|nr:recombination protein RecT [Aneurinibacillus sp. Ricciae_BoGa-3]WCK53868.1 recombination protein RecT [Aneurinibacillus sp. Ricciae_BoGa-3]